MGILAVRRWYPLQEPQSSKAAGAPATSTRSSGGMSPSGLWGEPIEVHHLVTCDPAQ